MTRRREFWTSVADRARHSLPSFWCDPLHPAKSALALMILNDTAARICKQLDGDGLLGLHCGGSQFPARPIGDGRLFLFAFMLNS